jgi:predicted aspartyl protease
MATRRYLVIAGALLVGVVGQGLAEFAHAAEPTHQSYPLKLTRGDRLLLAVEVNGHSVEALLDSAAEASFVDREFAQRIGLVGAESVTAKGSGEKDFVVPLSNGVTLAAAGLTLRDQTVAITDLSDVGRRLFGHPLSMILGRELFDAARLRIDVGRRTLEVVDADWQAPGVRIPLATRNGIETLEVMVEGKPAAAAFDLGNGSNVLIGSAYAEQRGLLRDGRAVTSEQAGGLGGQTTRTVIQLKSLELAGFTLTDIAASIDSGDSATDLNIGMSVLRHFRITTDFPAHAVWLEPVDR